MGRESHRMCLDQRADRPDDSRWFQGRNWIVVSVQCRSGTPSRVAGSYVHRSTVRTASLSKPGVLGVCHLG